MLGNAKAPLGTAKASLGTAKASLACGICVLYTHLAAAEVPPKYGTWNSRMNTDPLWAYSNAARVKKHLQDITPTFQESSSV